MKQTLKLTEFLFFIFREKKIHFTFYKEVGLLSDILFNTE